MLRNARAFPARTGSSLKIQEGEGVLGLVVRGGAALIPGPLLPVAFTAYYRVVV